MTMTRTQLAIVAGIILIAGAILYGMGHPLICECGAVKLWHFDVMSAGSDILFMIFGFYLAAWLPVWLTIVVAVAPELFIGFMIRDNLTLNVIMFVWPRHCILHWQQGRSG